MSNIQAIWATYILCVICTSAALAHEGHDHSTPSGDWPTHAPGDVIVLGPTMPTPIQATVWKQADGSTGTSPNPLWNDSIITVLSDINTIAYDDEFVYIRASGVPSHSIGLAGDTSPNPAVPGDLDATYRITLNPTPAMMNRATALASIGVAVNGAALFNWSDGTFWDPDTNTLIMDSPNNSSGWNTIAPWARAASFDPAGGHPAGGPGRPLAQVTYHYHQDPYGLEAQLDPGNTGQRHSPIVGFAFDGYPIYGPYAYTNGVDDSQGFRQMTSSYQLIAARPANGPDEADFELGSFAEDYQYIAGSGTLNEFNMAMVVTPEFPQGTWAYFTTYDLNGSGTDLDGDIAYPFTMGPRYFGIVDQAMIPPRDTITVPDDVTFFFEYAPLLLGDLNLDGVADLLDVQPFIDILLTGGYQAEADINQDSVVDLLDVSGFVDILLGN